MRINNQFKTEYRSERGTHAVPLFSYPFHHFSAREIEKQVYKLRDFSSLEKDADRYVVFQRNDSTLIKVIFEPNEDIIREMKMAAPRKVNIKGEERPY